MNQLPTTLFIIQRAVEATSVGLATSTTLVIPTPTLSTSISSDTSSPPTATPTGSSDGNSDQTPFLYFIALGLGIVFTNIWVVLGLKYCFRNRRRNAMIARGEIPDEDSFTGGPDDIGFYMNPLLATDFSRRRRRERRLMKFEELNERFPVMKYKVWGAERERLGLSAEGGISHAAVVAASRAPSIHEQDIEMVEVASVHVNMGDSDGNGENGDEMHDNRDRHQNDNPTDDDSDNVIYHEAADEINETDSDDDNDNNNNSGIIETTQDDSNPHSEIPSYISTSYHKNKSQSLVRIVEADESEEAHQQGEENKSNETDEKDHDNSTTTPSNDNSDTVINSLNTINTNISEDSAESDSHPHHMHSTFIPPESTESGDLCSICLDSIEPEHDIRALSCNHVFHDECITPWLTTRRASCPLCKMDFSSAKYRQDNPLASELNGDIASPEQAHVHDSANGNSNPTIDEADRRDLEANLPPENQLRRPRTFLARLFFSQGQVVRAIENQPPVVHTDPVLGRGSQPPSVDPPRRRVQYAPAPLSGNFARISYS